MFYLTSSTFYRDGVNNDVGRSMSEIPSADDAKSDPCCDQERRGVETTEKESKESFYCMFKTVLLNAPLTVSLDYLLEHASY